MLLDFVEKMAQNQSVPSLALTWEELEASRLPLLLRLRHSLGLDRWPEKTSLNARVLGRLDRPGYKIEKVVYEAWAWLPVTAHYISLISWKSQARDWCMPAGIGWKPVKWHCRSNLSVQGRLH